MRKTKALRRKLTIKAFSYPISKYKNWNYMTFPTPTSPQYQKTHIQPQDPFTSSSTSLSTYSLVHPWYYISTSFLTCSYSSSSASSLPVFLTFTTPLFSESHPASGTRFSSNTVYLPLYHQKRLTHQACCSCKINNLRAHPNQYSSQMFLSISKME